jgi:ABC-type antimicrobial peptide transport system permease subunit
MVEVIGVARTGKYLTLAETPQPYIYLPFSQNPRTRMTLLVETNQPLGMTEALLSVVRSLDPNQPVFNVWPLRSYYELGVLGPALIVLQMVGSTGLVGLTLALVGLYGLVAYSVSRRVREIGIRMAIGASRSRILRLVLKQGLSLALIGVAAGLSISIPLSKAMARGLAGLGDLSPWTLMIVPVTLLVATAAACYWPAWRASRIDPNVALRYE